jgi:hypothetical protein
MPEIRAFLDICSIGASFRAKDATVYTLKHRGKFYG